MQRHDLAYSGRIITPVWAGGSWAEDLPEPTALAPDCAYNGVEEAASATVVTSTKPKHIRTRDHYPTTGSSLDQRWRPVWKTTALLQLRLDRLHDLVGTDIRR